ncbi:unnamed protein product [Lactuca virosa]|uniref:Uncharacterized protein n=1 Tax=Lactuca virosa TaxID=75947 RepID=A0AAU9PTS3_9ASTR|nr:unnamed protein product [Lactuca virosa]
MKNEGAAETAPCSPVSLQIPLPFLFQWSIASFLCSLPYGNADCHHPRRPIASLQLPSAPTEGYRSFVASSFGLAKPQRSSLFPSFSSFSVVPIDRIVAHRRRKPTARRSPTSVVAATVPPSLLLLLPI